MPINKSSGTITADEIRDEFGPTGTVSFDDYRVSETHGSLSGMPLDKLAGANQDKNIPQSGVLSFSDFYNSRLNVVVKISQDDVTATDVYDNNNSAKVKVVGGLRGRPSKSNMGGRRVYINVNTELESPANHQDHKQRCTLRTGEWVNGQFNNNVGTGTSLSVDIGSSGKIYGAGGRGGNGATGTGQGSRGQDGSSALGIEFGASNNKVFINNAGYLQAGYGGGGGGGGGYDDPNKESHDYTNAGAGGGGGAGKVHGEGGGGAEAWSGHEAANGNEGDAEDGGDGGGASGYEGTSEKGSGNEGLGGAGGEGGGVGSPATNGTAASGNSIGNGGGGAAGESGWAILNENASNCITVTGSGTVADNKIQHNTNPED